MHGLDISKKRILAYQTKAPAAPDSHLNPLRVVYSVKTPMSQKSGSRYIPTNPERILDAPDIINDYYLNLLDWSSDNIVTVALGSSVYLWNAGTGNIEILFENEAGDNACSLSWVQDGCRRAVHAPRCKKQGAGAPGRFSRETFLYRLRWRGARPAPGAKARDAAGDDHEGKVFRGNQSVRPRRFHRVDLRDEGFETRAL